MKEEWFGGKNRFKRSQDITHCKFLNGRGLNLSGLWNSFFFCFSVVLCTSLVDSHGTVLVITFMPDSVFFCMCPGDKIIFSKSQFLFFNNYTNELHSSCYPEKSWMPHPWWCLRPGWMRPFTAELVCGIPVHDKVGNPSKHLRKRTSLALTYPLLYFFVLHCVTL